MAAVLSPHMQDPCIEAWEAQAEFGWPSHAAKAALPLLQLLQYLNIIHREMTLASSVR